MNMTVLTVLPFDEDVTVLSIFPLSQEDWFERKMKMNVLTALPIDEDNWSVWKMKMTVLAVLPEDDDYCSDFSLFKWG